jgi:hypothetical protein
MGFITKTTHVMIIFTYICELLQQHEQQQAAAPVPCTDKARGQLLCSPEAVDKIIHHHS